MGFSRSLLSIFFSLWKFFPQSYHEHFKEPLSFLCLNGTPTSDISILLEQTNIYLYSMKRWYMKRWLLKVFFKRNASSWYLPKFFSTKSIKLTCVKVKLNYKSLIREKVPQWILFVMLWGWVRVRNRLFFNSTGFKKFNTKLIYKKSEGIKYCQLKNKTVWCLRPKDISKDISSKNVIEVVTCYEAKTKCGRGVSNILLTPLPHFVLAS